MDMLASNCDESLISNGCGENPYGCEGSSHICTTEHRSISQSAVSFYDSFAGQPAEDTAISKHQTGIPRVVLSLSKVYMGSGVLFLPRAFEHGGYLVGSVILAVFALIGVVASLRLIEARKHVGAVPYGRVMEVAAGSVLGRYAVDVSIVLLQFGIVISYFIFVSKQMHTVLLQDWSHGELIALQLVILAPLCWIRQVSRLAYPSMIADVMAVTCLVAVTIYNYLSVETIYLSYGNSFTDTFVCCGTMCFVFEGVCLVIPIYDSMRDEDKFPCVFSSVYAHTFLLYLVVGLGGALAWAKPYGSGYGTRPIILDNLKEDAFGKTIQLCYSAAILFTAPLMWLPAIRILELPIFGPPVSDPPRAKQMLKSAFRTLVMAFIAFLSWIAYSYIDNVVSMIGAFCGTPLLFIYPSYAHSALSATRKEKVENYLIMAVGVFVLVVATSVNIMEISKGKS